MEPEPIQTRPGLGIFWAVLIGGLLLLFAWIFRWPWG